MSSDKAVAVVEVQAAEHLVFPVAQLGAEVIPRGARAGQQRAFAQRFELVAPRQFQRGLQPGIARGAHAGVQGFRAGLNYAAAATRRAEYAGLLRWVPELAVAEKPVWPVTTTALAVDAKVTRLAACTVSGTEAYVVSSLATPEERVR